eukprot:1155916-Pelagomonas_calceolata.AAC.16
MDKVCVLSFPRTRLAQAEVVQDSCDIFVLGQQPHFRAIKDFGLADGTLGAALGILRRWLQRRLSSKGEHSIRCKDVGTRISLRGIDPGQRHDNPCVGHLPSLLNS